MGVVFILLGASLTVAIGFLIAFIWSVKSGQYDDDYTPSVRMLFDDNTIDAKTGGHTERSRSVTEAGAHVSTPLNMTPHVKTTNTQNKKYGNRKISI